MSRSNFMKRLKTISGNFTKIIKGKSYNDIKSDKDNKPIVMKYLDNKTPIVSIRNKTEREIEEVAFENEEAIGPLTEKEKDASVRSRLSKEVDKLKQKKMILTSSGLNIAIDKNQNWEEYNFDNTIKDLKKTLAPISAKVLSFGDAGSGPTISENRPVRGEPGKVLFTFIPMEWYTFFIPKTGYTGAPTFFFTFSTYMISKEHYVLEHNFYNGLSMAILVGLAIKYLGPPLAQYLDKEIDQYENGWNQGRVNLKNFLNEQIGDEIMLQYQIQGQMLLMEAKRENVALQLEEEYRKRLMIVYKEVLRRLDYQLQVENVRKKIQHKNLVQYVMKEVLKAITPDLQNKLINYSIDNLVAELKKTDEDKQITKNEEIKKIEPKDSKGSAPKNE